MDVDYDKIPEDIKAHFQVSSARGQVLNTITMLEVNIDIFLSNHFCATEAQSSEMIELVLTRMTFDAKRLIFKFIIEKYPKYNQFISEHKTFHADLGRLYDERNLFAHFPMDITAEGLKIATETKQMVFIKFKNTLDRKFHTNETVTNLINEILKYSDAIGKLIDVKHIFPPQNTTP